MSTMQEKEYLQEDEIDLRELFNTLYQYKIFIIGFTLCVTLIAAIYVYAKTPIYEVKSNVQMGYIGKNLIDSSAVIVKKLNIIFNVKDKPDKKNQFISEVSSITTNKKLKNFIEIKTQAITNDDALKKNKEVVQYLQQIYAPKINQYIINTKNSIKDTQQRIKNIDNFETKNVQLQIKLLKTQAIVKIDEKIKFYQKMQIPTLETKIKFNVKKLKEYTKAVNNLYQHNQNTKDVTALTISSIEMVNYQNLILNSQNKIEDLKLAIDKINNETLPNLQRKKDNIQNDSIRKLEHQLTVTLPNKKMKLQEKIEQLKFTISPQNLQNSQVVGHYIIHDYPVKPKKKLIIIVAFITGFILSIFLVLFYTFIKKED